jgi:hypothetical protein
VQGNCHENLLSSFWAGVEAFSKDRAVAPLLRPVAKLAGPEATDETQALTQAWRVEMPSTSIFSQARADSFVNDLMNYT